MDYLISPETLCEPVSLTFVERLFDWLGPEQVLRFERTGVDYSRSDFLFWSWESGSKTVIELRGGKRFCRMVLNELRRGATFPLTNGTTVEGKWLGEPVYEDFE